MSNEELEISNTGRDLIKKWHEAGQRVNDVKSNLNRVETDFLNAAIKLTKWAVPKDAQIGDNFLLPVGEGFLNIRVTEKVLENFETEIKWRPFPIKGI